MARIWSSRSPGYRLRRTEPLLPQSVYHVRVCAFDFHFYSTDQIRECLAFYSEKVHPSFRLSMVGHMHGDHGEAQQWHSRLPIRLQRESNRRKVVRALQAALAQFDPPVTRH